MPWITLPDEKWRHICKVFPGPDGKDVLLTTMAWSVSRPYPVTYAPDGSLALGRPSAPSP